MKAKLMALLMSVGLGVTGVTATVQAAGARAEEEKCMHEIIDTVVLGRYTTDYNDMYHIVYYILHHVCSRCPGYDAEDIYYELHDYENIYDDKGHMICSYCTGCDAIYYY